MVTKVTIPIKNNKGIKIEDLTNLGCVLTNTVTRIDEIPYFISVEKGTRILRFVALVVHPDKLSVEHGSLVGVAHVVVGSGVGKVQILPEQVIFYFYC